MANRKVYLNTLAQIAGKISTAIISIFLVKILTNYLDIAGYGLYSKIYNYLSIFSVIADLGLYTITVREISEHKDNDEKVRKIAGTVLTIRTFMGSVIIAISFALAMMLPGYDTHAALAGVLIAGIFTLFGLINSSILSLLQAYLKTEFSFISTTLGKITNLLSVLLTVFILLPKPFPDPATNSFPFEEAAFVLIMLSGLLGNLVMTISLYLYSRRVEKIGFIFDREYAVHILKSSLPYGIALFLNAIFFKVDVILLSILEPHKIADTNIALYGVPMKIVEVGMMFGVVFLNSMLPLFTESIKKGSADLAWLVRRAYLPLFFFGAGTAAFLAVGGSGVIALIANDTYLHPGPSGYQSLDAMRIVAFVFFFYFLSSLFTYLLIAKGEQKRLLTINSWIAGANIVGNILLIPFFSFVGSAIVTLVSQILLCILTAHAAKDITKHRFFLQESAWIILLAIVCSGLTFLTRNALSAGAWENLPVLIFSALAFGIPYLLGGWAIKRFSETRVL